MLKSWRGFYLGVFASVFFVGGCATVDFEESVTVTDADSVKFALNELPYPDQWTRIEFSGDPVGFTHQRVGEGEMEGEMRIDSEAYLRFFVLGVEKQAIIVGTDWVNLDLTLKRFEYRYTVDGVVKRVRGELQAGRLLTQVEKDGETISEDLPASFPLYPGRAFSLYPVIRGLEVGKEFAFRFYDGESQTIKPVVQVVEAFGTGERIDGSAYKLVSNISGSKTTTWIDTLGRPLLEISFGGIFFAALQDSQQTMLDLVEDAFAREVDMKPYTQIPVAEGVISDEPGREMTVYLRGTAAQISLPSDSFQHCWTQDLGIVCQVIAGDTANAAVELQIEFDHYLGADERVDSNSPVVVALAERFRATHENPIARADAAYEWLAANVRRVAQHNSVASTTIAEERGSARDLTESFIALTRAMRIPTRFVHGLAYVRDESVFAYHTWAEIWVDGVWHRFDPALSQLRADVTHLKFATGQLVDNAPMFAKIIGRVEVQVLSYE